MVCRHLVRLAAVPVQGFMRAPPQPAGGGHVLFDHFWVAMGDRPLPEDGVHADGEITIFIY